MSDSNVGARKNMNVRNHLFIIYGIINDVLHKEDHCIRLQIFDIVKAFDSIWLEDRIIELLETKKIKRMIKLPSFIK